jgi:hypothetical protein
VPPQTFASSYERGALAAVAVASATPARDIAVSTAPAPAAVPPPPRAARPGPAEPEGASPAPKRRDLLQAPAPAATAAGTIASYRIWTRDAAAVTKSLQAALADGGARFYGLLAENGVPLRPSVALGGSQVLAGGPAVLPLVVVAPEHAQPHEAATGGLAGGEAAGVAIGCVAGVGLLGAAIAGVAAQLRRKRRRESFDELEAAKAVSVENLGQLRAKYSKQWPHLPAPGGVSVDVSATASGAKAAAAAAGAAAAAAGGKSPPPQPRAPHSPDSGASRDQDWAPPLRALAVPRPGGATPAAPAGGARAMAELEEAPAALPPRVQLQRVQSHRISDSQFSLTSSEPEDAASPRDAPPQGGRDAGSPPRRSQSLPGRGAVPTLALPPPPAPAAAAPAAPAAAAAVAAGGPLRRPPEAATSTPRGGAAGSAPGSQPNSARSSLSHAAAFGGAPLPLPPGVVTASPAPAAVPRHVHAVRLGSGLDFSAMHRSNYSVLGASMPGGRLITAERVRAQQTRGPGGSSAGGSPLGTPTTGRAGSGRVEWPAPPLRMASASAVGAAAAAATAHERSTAREQEQAPPHRGPGPYRTSSL